MTKTIHIITLAAVIHLIAGCGTKLPLGTAENSEKNDGTVPGSAASPAASAPDASASPSAAPQSLQALPDDLEHLTACRSMGETFKVPASTADVVALINSLITARNSPVTLPCLLAALPRPLKLSVVNSTVSAQPSDGPSNPRVFIKYGTLYLSVTSEGVGANLLEFSEFIAAPDSVKGELKFPIDKAIDGSLPFSRLAVDLGGGRIASSCSNCHANERPVDGAAFPASSFPPSALMSRALKPRSSQILPLSALSRLNSECYVGGAFRCGLIRSLFIGEDPSAFDFPEDMPTFF